MKQKYAEHGITLHDIIDVLGEDERPGCSAAAGVAVLLKEHGNLLYKDAVYYIAHLDLAPVEARDLWQRMLAHKRSMSKKLRRNIGIRVAALDFFLNVEKRITEPKIIETALLERIQDASGRDALTGVANYSAFRDRIQKEISRSGRYGEAFSLMVFDIDSFKRYNDTHGHKEGDTVLKRISQVLRRCIRDSDFVARYGGEEFVVILVETSKKQAATVAERIRKAVADLKLKERVTISGGIASFPTDAVSEARLFEYADKALYRAKAEGKNKICLFYKERRRFVRLGASPLITINRISRRAPVQPQAMTANIGAGGIAIHYPHVAPVSSFVTATVHLGPNKDVPFRGRIVRVEEIPKGVYEIAIKFLWIRKEDRRQILEFIERHRR